MPIKLKPLRKIKSEIIPPPKLGEMVSGKVIATDRSSVFLDLGAKGIGVVYGAEFYKARDSLKGLEIGAEVTAKVIGLENEEGYRELSVVGASREISWQELKGIKERNEPFGVKIKKANKGGLIAEVKGIPAFLPVSQLASEHYPKIEGADPIKIARSLQKFIDQTLKVRIIDLDPRKEKLILSEKIGVDGKKERAIGKYKLGDIVAGKVSGITNFGAFIGLEDGVEGLLYPSEAVEKGERSLEEVLKVGQEIKAKIIKIADNRIYLSLKI